MIRLHPHSEPNRAILPRDSSFRDGILDAIGSTPLVRLRRYLDIPNVKLLCKLESFNPGGSAKDRPATRMLEYALDHGLIDETSTIVESSSGNMGIGLAQACRYYGLQFVCVVDPNAQAQHMKIMKALGAQIEQVQAMVNGSYLEARWSRVEELVAEIDGAYWPNQYANPQNPLAHRQGTIREIIESVDGDLDYLFVATSSTGTASGCRDYLRSIGMSTKVIAVDAEGSALFGGKSGPRRIPGLGAGREPKLAEGQSFDQVHRVTDSHCIVGCRRLAATEAILVGGSAGGVLETVRAMEKELVGKSCVAILHDSGTRYLDTIFDDDWVEQATGLTATMVDELVGTVVKHSRTTTRSNKTQTVETE